jgi:hypothetical protein
MEEDLRELLRQLENEGKTLAVFVDDLDRCSPKRVADVVETINVFFGQEEVGKCLFVLGMHRELVATSLQLAHKELVAELGESPYLCEELPFGQRFLEKIVQFLVRLPEPSKEEVDAYVAHLSGGEGAPALATEHLRGLREELQADGDFLNREPEHRQRVVSVLASGLGLELKDAEPIADDLVSGEHARRIAKKFDEGSSEALRVFGAVRVGLRSNPRQYKRFFNALRFLYHFQVFRTRLEPRLEELLDLAKRVALTLEWPELIPAVESDAEAYARLRDAAEQGKLKDVLRELLAKTGLTGAAIADGQMLSNAVAHCLAGGRMESLLLANVD